MNARITTRTVEAATQAGVAHGEHTTAPGDRKGADKSATTGAKGVKGKKSAKADAVLWSRSICGLLGLNLWLVFLLIPTWTGGERSGWVGVVSYGAPFIPLTVGLLSGHAMWLLALYPSVLAACAGVRHVTGGVYMVSVGGLTLGGLSFAVYVALSAAVLEWEKRPPFDAANYRALEGVRTTSQWKRRQRVYAYLLAATVVMPALMLYCLNARPESWPILRYAYEERAPQMRVLINMAVVGFWTLVFFVALRKPLHLHQRGDVPLRREIRRYRSGKRQHVINIVVLSGLALGLLALFWLLYG
jgi:hypothetical protein